MVAAFLAPCCVMLPCAIVSANNAIVADRYFYMGMASGVGIGGALLGARLFAWMPSRSVALFAVLPLALGFETRERARDWTNDVTLFTASLEHGVLRAGFYLGSYFHNRNDCAAAIPFYRLALETDPRAADNLQACLVDVGEIDEALTLAPIVTGPRAWHQVPYLNTARAYVRKNDLERARDYVVQATTRFPDDARGWVMLGNIEGMRGDLDAADLAFAKALAIRPDDTEARAGKEKVDRARPNP
jgi:tetratricopeptide (TPR) repeat protein